MTWQPIETMPNDQWVTIQSVTGIEATARVTRLRCGTYCRVRDGNTGKPRISCTRKKGGDIVAVKWKPLSTETITPSVKTMITLPNDLHLPSLLRSSISLALCMGMVSQETHDKLYEELRGK